MHEGGSEKIGISAQFLIRAFSISLKSHSSSIHTVFLKQRRSNGQSTSTHQNLFSKLVETISARLSDTSIVYQEQQTKNSKNKRTNDD